MNKYFRCLVVFVVIGFFNTVFAQQLKSSIYSIENVGIITISNQLELQGGNYKKFSEAYQKTMSEILDFQVSDSRVVFQPKGINNFESKALALYSRVIIETDVGNYGDYDALKTKYTTSEILEFNSAIKQQVYSELKGTTMNIVKWLGTSVVTINGMNAIKVSYIRQLQDNPFVIVNTYIFQNKDRVHRLIMSYRQVEEEIWKPQFSKVLESFKITNIR